MYDVSGVIPIDFIQRRNPNTGKYVKINKKTNQLTRKKSSGPYKNIRILTKPGGWGGKK